MNHLNTVVASLGAVLLSSAAFSVQAASNPFAAQELSSGYSLAAGEKSAEGSCGEGKCGGEMKKAEDEAKTDAEGKCGEGKCGAEKKAE